MTLPIILINETDIFFPKVRKRLYINKSSSKASVDYARNNGTELAFLFEKQKVDENNADFYKYAVIGDILQVSTEKQSGKEVYKVDLYIKERIIVPHISELENEGVFVLNDYIPYIEKNTELSKENILLLGEYIKNCLTELTPYFNQVPFDDQYITTQAISTIEDVEKFLYEILTGLQISNEEKYKYLKELGLERQLMLLFEFLKEKTHFVQKIATIDEKIEKKKNDESDILFIKERIQDYQRELEERTGVVENGAQYKMEALDEMPLTSSEKEKIKSEINKLNKIGCSEEEKGRQIDYLDNVFSMPFNKRSTINKDLNNVKNILNQYHYGVDDVKEKIIENIAFQNASLTNETPVLCLTGPPGVGKTSFGHSIAKATGREMIRVSLGGVENESEIRGHRRTYLGAKIGRILNAIKESGVKNPLVLLDEIDKIKGGSESSAVVAALLEVLDSSQNKHFRDHYLEIGFDLSEVMFVATSNSLDMPEPLLDRMDIVSLSGYTENEKLHIVKQYTLPKILSKLTINEFNIEEEAIRKIINSYTQESGVRELERVLHSFVSKTLKKAMINNEDLNAYFKNKQYTVDDIETELGPIIYKIRKLDETNKIGIVNGLAWSSHGGVVLKVEAVKTPGSGKMALTGHLGDIMKESAQAALTIIKSAYTEAAEKVKESDLHIHLPEGSVPKDGPSAGIALTVSIISALKEEPVKNDVAMTGEISLSGDVLGVGGVKEKVLAASRAGIKTIIIPKENEDDIKEIYNDIEQKVTIKPVEKIEQAVNIALSNPKGEIK